MPATPSSRLRLVVLVSGSGTNLQALIDACEAPGFPAEIVAVGADRPGILALERAERAGIPTYVLRVGDFAERDQWDVAFTEATVGAGVSTVLIVATILNTRRKSTD